MRVLSRARHWLQDSRGLGQRTMKAGSWNLINTTSEYFLRVVSNLIMTRLLLPEAFGIMALASVFLAGLNLFTDIGLKRSVVREKDGDEANFLRTTWTVKILRGGFISCFLLVLAGLVWLLAPSLAKEGTVYAAPELPGVICIIALSPLMQGFAATSVQLTMRRLELGRFTLFEMGARVFGIACMAGFASVYPTVWALTLGMLMQDVAMLIFSHRFLPGPRMALIWDSEIVQRIWRFGRWLLASAVMTFLGKNADKFFLGATLGSATFGIYVIAQIWITAGHTLITRLAEGVGFSMMAEVIRTREKDVPRLFRKLQFVVDGFCLSAFLVTYLLGQVIIDFLYTETYSLAGQLCQLMSALFLFVRFEPLGSLLVNYGNTQSTFIISAVRAVTTCIFIPVGFALLGVTGAIMGLVLVNAVTVPYVIYKTHPILGTGQTVLNVVTYALGILGAVLVYLTV